jgi:hypothetical protein
LQVNRVVQRREASSDTFTWCAVTVATPGIVSTWLVALVEWQRQQRSQVLVHTIEVGPQTCVAALTADVELVLYGMVKRAAATVAHTAPQELTAVVIVWVKRVGESVG